MSIGGDTFTNKKELGTFLKMKRIHMLYGIGRVPDRDAYGALELAVREFADWVRMNGRA